MDSHETRARTTGTMECMLIVAFPGQGSQKPGFLAPWLANPEARSTLDRLSEAIDLDLATHGTDSDAATIRKTDIAQPLIVAAGILAWDALVRRLRGDAPARIGVAGHSVGEIAAAYAAGIFDAETAMRFVAARSSAMAEATRAEPSGMAAVLGGDPDSVVAALESFGLEPANFNGGGQIVAAGAPEALERLRLAPPARTRVVPLRVAGAFHTSRMRGARERLRALRSTFTVHDPRRPIWTNRDGSLVASGDAFLDDLVDQVARPVRWDRCMEAFAADGISALVEAAPAGTLVGLAKRALRGVPAVAVNAPDDLAAATAFLDRAGESDGGARADAKG